LYRQLVRIEHQTNVSFRESGVRSSARSDLFLNLGPGVDHTYWLVETNGDTKAGRILDRTSPQRTCNRGEKPGTPRGSPPPAGTLVLRKYSVPRGLQYFQRARDCPLTMLRVDRQSSDVPYFRRTGNYVLQVCRPGDDGSRALALTKWFTKGFSTAH